MNMEQLVLDYDWMPETAQPAPQPAALISEKDAAIEALVDQGFNYSQATQMVGAELSDVA